MASKPPAKRRKVAEPSVVMEPSAASVAASLTRIAPHSKSVDAVKVLRTVIEMTPVPAKTTSAPLAATSPTTTTTNNKLEQKILGTAAATNKRRVTSVTTTTTTTTTSTKSLTNNNHIIVKSENGVATRHFDMSDQSSAQLLTKPNIFPYLVSCGTGVAGHGIEDIGKQLDDHVFTTYARAVGKSVNKNKKSGSGSAASAGTLATRICQSKLDLSFGVPSTILPPDNNDDDITLTDDNDSVVVDDAIRVSDDDDDINTAHYMRINNNNSSDIQRQLHREFCQTFLYDTPEQTPLVKNIQEKFVTANNPTHRYISEFGEHYPTSDSRKVNAAPLLQSYVLKQIKEESGGFFNRNTAEARNNVEQLPSCPIDLKAILDSWLVSSESDRDRPTCMYGENCLCVTMASRSGSIAQDHRIPHTVMNGSVQLTSRKATTVPDVEATNLVRDRLAYTNAPTQGFIGLRYMTSDELVRWKSDKRQPVEAGPCLVCHLDEVTNTHQMLSSGNYLGDGSKLKRNKFCVLVDRPGEFRSDVCLPMLPANLETSSLIHGYFPRFDPQDFDYDSVVIEGMRRKTPILRWIGMDFRPSSVG